MCIELFFYYHFFYKDAETLATSSTNVYTVYSFYSMSFGPEYTRAREACAETI